MNSYPKITLGVEEEYQLVDPASGILRPSSRQVLQGISESQEERLPSDIHHELHLTQIEMASNVCESLAEARDQVLKTRQRLVAAAERAGAALISAGTNPLTPPHADLITPSHRYRSMTRQYQYLARELVIFGCHIHVGIPSRNIGIGIMNHCRPWLPLLQAMTANSPFWHNEDTGYASYRREMWSQWPLAGPPPQCKTADEYAAIVDELIQVGAIADATRIYWDIRLPEKIPTIEFRVADAMTRLDETIGFAAVIKGLVLASLQRIHDAEPVPRVRAQTLKFAMWQAARFGVTAQLTDCVAGKKESAKDQLARLLDVIQKPLKTAGGWEFAEQWIAMLKQEGTGADRQRAALAERNEMRDVVAMLISQTANAAETAST